MIKLSYLLATASSLVLLGACSADDTASPNADAASAFDAPALPDSGTDSAPADGATPQAKTFNVTIARLAPGNGATLVSNGIPFGPGALMPADVGSVRVTVDGVEQSIYAEALAGRHPDGSVRFLLIQFQLPLTAGSPVTGVIELGKPRTKPDLTRQPTVSDPPAGVAFPDATRMSAALGSTWPGPIVPATAIVAPPWLKTHSDRWAVEATRVWNANGGAKEPNDIAIYELASSRYWQFVRTGDPTWFARGYHYGETYRVFINGGPEPEWLNSTPDLVMHYWFSGDTRILASITGLVNFGHSQNHFGDVMDVGNARATGRWLQAALLSRLLGVDPGTCKYTDCDKFGYGTLNGQQWNNDKALDFTVKDVISHQAPNGSFPGKGYGGGQKHYMIAMALTGLEMSYDLYKADPAILTTVKKACDYVWQQYQTPTINGVPTGQTKKLLYCTTTAGDCSASEHPILAGMWVPVLTWYAHQTGDTTYRDHADEFIQYADSDYKNLVYNNRALDEGYWYNFQAYAWR